MPIDFNKYPYYDDFNEDNLYYRLLFQPGRAVQARELTQIQTLLQSQIERIGKHIFKDGALVHGGNIHYNGKQDQIHWIAVKAQSPQGNPVRIRDIKPGMIIKKVSDSSSMDTQFEAKITSVVPAEGDDPNTIYFKWSSSSPEFDSQGFLASETLKICDSESGLMRYSVVTLDADVNAKNIHTGKSSQISVDPGIYFWKGLFVKSPGGSIVLNKYSDFATYRIGYTVTEEIDTTDPRSLDPASHASNYSAPGADRYRVVLNLIKYGNGVSMDENVISNFIEVARVDAGNFMGSSIDASRDIYNILGDELAARTYDESGNYIVQGFDINLSDKTTSDNPKMVAKLSKGVAYVRGYRHSLNYQNYVSGVEGISKGRDVLQEELNIGNDYGDNFLLVYDHANTTFAAHPENANGIFTVGSGAGVYTSNSWYGNRGEAVAIHCVPQQLVKDHSLSGQWAWESTLVGTARPIQMSYNTARTRNLHTKHRDRDGLVYNLWLGDFQGSSITNTTPTTNLIENVSAYANASHTVFHYTGQSHGITANDRISTTGSTTSDWNVDYLPVLDSNTTALVIAGKHTSAASPGADTLTLHRTTGNNSPYRTIVLDTDSSAAWNGSYIGATIKVGNSSPNKIVDYIGTHSTARDLYYTRNKYARTGLAILENDLEELPKIGDSYTISFGMTQARSVVYNQNKSSTGAEQYPAILNQSWNVEPIYGMIQSSGSDLLHDEVYGNRVSGDAKYNRFGESPRGEDALLFSTRRTATKSIMTHGALDSSTGQTSNTEVIYTEYASKKQTSSGSSELTFATPSAGSVYVFFDRPECYPFKGTGTKQTIQDLDEIRSNFILTNKITGKNITKDITQVEVNDGAAHQITVTISGTYTQNQEYILLFPVKAEYATPAYKKLIKANTGFSLLSAAPPSDGDLTDYSVGHVVFANASYGTTAGTRFDLRKPDAVKLHKVVHQFKNGQANTDIANTMLNITDRFIFDTGQRDMFYDNASVVLKSGVDAPTGNVLVIFDRFTRMDKPKSDAGRVENLDSPSYFAVDSYQFERS